MGNLALNIAMRLLGRGFAAVYSVDNNMKLLTRELLGDKESFTTRIGVMGNPVNLVMTSTKNGITSVNNRLNLSKIDLNIIFKHRGDALKVMTGQASIIDAYTVRAFYVEGNIASLMTCLEQCELVLAYLLPEGMVNDLLGYSPERTAKKSSAYKRLVFAKRL